MGPTWEIVVSVSYEGGMYLLMTVFDAIGHIYGDASWGPLLVASTVRHIITGKYVDRVVFAFKFLDEELNYRFYTQLHILSGLSVVVPWKGHYNAAYIVHPFI